MSPIDDWRSRLRSVGVWAPTDGLPASRSAELAARIESLGYSAMWVPDTMGRRRRCARRTVRSALGIYADLPNYRNNWLRLGFSDEDIESRSDSFIDAFVAWGDAKAIGPRVDEHRDAGADHVCSRP